MNTAITIVGIALLCFLMTCWAITDVARKDFGSLEMKIVWGIVAWIPFIGFILYIIWGYRRGKPVIKQI